MTTSAVISARRSRTSRTQTARTAVTATDDATADSTRNSGKVRSETTDAKKPRTSTIKPTAYSRPAANRLPSAAPRGIAAMRCTPIACSTVAVPYAIAAAAAPSRPTSTPHAAARRCFPQVQSSDPAGLRVRVRDPPGACQQRQPDVGAEYGEAGPG